MESLSIANLFSVKDRIALVTGGSSGLGLMICKGLVVNGAKVYVVALPSDAIDKVVDELNTLGRESGGSAIGISCDVSDKADVERLEQTIAAKEDRLDMLISNAGIRRDPPLKCNVLTASLEDLQSSLWSARPEDWRNTFEVNVTAHYYMSVAFMSMLEKAANMDIADGMKGRDEGRGVVVVTSSCASMHNVTNVDLTSYAASKAGTDHLVKLLASKFARWYVRVVGINPGFVPSNMNPVGAEGNMFSALFDKMPAKRAGRAEDIAGTVLYLVSKAGAYVDGISLCVDGGRILLANGQE